MHIDPLEKEWVYVTLAMTGLFVGVILLTSFVHGVDTPSHVEPIDSARLHLSEEFGEDNLGVQVKPDGGIVVRVVAGRYGFFPRHIKIPAETKITFRWASMDVLHGVHIPMTNMSTMILPGYVAEVTTVFPKPGDYRVWSFSMNTNLMGTTFGIPDFDDVASGNNSDTKIDSFIFSVNRVIVSVQIFS